MTVCYTAPQSLAVSLITTPLGKEPDGVVILDTAPLRGALYSRLVIIIVSKSGFFHAGMVKSRLYSPLRDKYGSSKVPPPDLGTQIRTSLRYLSLKQSCV